MKKFEDFTIQHPILFGFLLILLFSILSTLTWPLTQVKTTPQGYETGTAIAKLVMAACFILLLGGLGWLKIAGFTTLGSRRIWWLLLLLMIYRGVAGIYAFTGGLQFGLPGIELTLAVLIYSFATSLVEESMYRGLLLTAMTKAWGSSRKGLYAAAILSSLFWACTHFVNLIIRPFPVVALLVLETAISGFVYAAMVLSSRSIWPVVIIHWAINAIIGLQISMVPGFEETNLSGIIFSLTALPLAAVGVYLMEKCSYTHQATESGALPPMRLQSAQD